MVMGVAGQAVEGESSIWVTFSPTILEVGTVKTVLAQAELLIHRWYLRLQQPQPLGNPRRLLFHRLSRRP